MQAQGRQKTEHDIQTTSSIYVEAKLVGDFASLKRLLDGLPKARVMSCGTRIRCIIENSSGTALLELDRNGIIYSYTTDHDSVHSSNANLVVMLSILAYLGGVYEVRLPSLYGYLVGAINAARIGVQEPAEHRSDCRLKELAESNVVLADSIRRISGENGVLKANIEVYRKLLFRVLQRLSKRALSEGAMQDLSRELGVEPELFSCAAALLKKDRLIAGD